jgi:hypothetical protein
LRTWGTVFDSTCARVLACALLAAVIAVLAMAPLLSSAGWNPSVLARINTESALYGAAKRLDPGLRGVRPSAAYDGQFYWGIAVDPLALGSLHHDLDKPSYRYGHPLYGWLGWLLSGGQAAAVPVALVVVGLVSLAAAAALAVGLGTARGGTGREGLFIALNWGLIAAATADLAEPLAAALMLGGLTALRFGRRWSAWVCLALLPLAKEPLLVVVAAAVTWELLRGHRRNAALFATATIPAFIWWVYARIRLGAWFTSGTSALGLPLVGWGKSLFSAHPEGHVSALHHALTVAGLVALLVVLIAGAIEALHLRSLEQIAYLGLAATACCLALNATASFDTALRNVSFLVVLLPFVLTGRQRGERCSEREPQQTKQPAIVRSQSADLVPSSAWANLQGPLTRNADALTADASATNPNPSS